MGASKDIELGKTPFEIEYQNSAMAKFYRVAVVSLLVLVLANALAAGLRTITVDMGWRLATGRWVVEHHAIPSTDVLSYTTAGHRWVYPPFAGALLYFIYTAAGSAGLSVCCALACVAVVAYLVRRRDTASLVLAMCAITPIAFRSGPAGPVSAQPFLQYFSESCGHSSADQAIDCGCCRSRW